jgi:protease-4
MKKFLLGLVVGFILTGLTAVIVIFSAIRFGDTKPSVADGSTLLLKLDGNMPERPGVDIPIPYFGMQAPLTVRDHWSILRNAATDNRIKGILLLPHGASLGWAKMEEIRQDLLAFKKSGKPVIAYLRNPRTSDYYVATAADKIYMSSEDVLDMKGLRAELMFLKGTLNKVGAEFEVMHIGKYKDAGDMLTQTTATPETREVMNSVLDQLYGGLVDVVAKSRKKSPDEVRKIIDDGPFIGKKAVQYGLIDGLKYEDEVYTEMKDKFQQKDGSESRSASMPAPCRADRTAASRSRWWWAREISCAGRILRRTDSRMTTISAHFSSLSCCARWRRTIP